MAWYPPIVTDGPETEPVSISEARRQINEDSSDQDGLLEDAILFACGRVESITGTRLVSQDITLRATTWDDLKNLNVAPVQSVTEIRYIGADGIESVLPASGYEARLWGLEPGVIVRERPALDSAGVITMEVVAGYADVPPPEVRLAILLLVGECFRNRESVSDETERAVLSLLHNHRRYL